MCNGKPMPLFYMIFSAKEHLKVDINKNIVEETIMILKNLAMTLLGLGLVWLAQGI